MTLTNASTATIDDDADADTSLIGTDDQGYDVSFDTVAECTNFNDGEFDLLPGASETGCVVYELPNGVNAQTVQFSLTDGYIDTAQWNA